MLIFKEVGSAVLAGMTTGILELQGFTVLLPEAILQV